MRDKGIKGDVANQIWVAVMRLRGKVRSEDAKAGRKLKMDPRRAIKELSMMLTSTRKSLSRSM